MILTLTFIINKLIENFEMISLKFSNQSSVFAFNFANDKPSKKNHAFFIKLSSNLCVIRQNEQKVIFCLTN